MHDTIHWHEAMANEVATELQYAHQKINLYQVKLNGIKLYWFTSDVDNLYIGM